MSVRKCRSCGHRAPVLAGRCTEPGGDTICGCSCTPGNRPALDARRASTADAGERVLRAVADGHTWGVGISAATGLQAVRAYTTLRDLVADGLLEREPGRGPRRDRYLLTEQGRQVAEKQ